MLRVMGGAMPKALQAGSAELPSPLMLSDQPSEEELEAVISATYQQLIDRIPFEAERLSEAESQLRDGDGSVVDFVSAVAASELFQARLHGLPPIQAAATAHLALLGRAPLPDEISVFLTNRTQHGQQEAVAQLIESTRYSDRFGRNIVPGAVGIRSSAGVPLVSLVQTARLAGGRAGLTPPPNQAVL